LKDNIKLINITNGNEIESITHDIISKLPEWFDKNGQKDYPTQNREKYFIAAMKGETPVGFIALTDDGGETAEIHCMGVLPSEHRNGIGSMLVKAAEKYCMGMGKSQLIVKTLDSAVNNPPYIKTWKFYKAMGFAEHRRLPDFWNKENPCLEMMKEL